MAARGKRAETGLAPTGNQAVPLASLMPGGNVIEHEPQSEFDPGTVGEDLSDDLALSAVLSQLGEDNSEAKVFVYKIDSKTQKEAFAYETTPTEFAIGGLTDLGMRFGGGDYRIRVYNEGRILTHKRISILPPANVQANPVPQTGLQLEGLQSLMQQNQAAMMQGFQMIAETIVKSIPQPPPQQSRMDFIAEMTAMQNLFGGGNKQSGPDFNVLVETFQKGLEMGTQKGEASAMDVLMEGFKTLAPTIIEATKQPLMQSAAMPVPHAPQMAAIPAPVSPVAPSNNPEGDEMKFAQEMMLKQSIKFLSAQGLKQADPETYAHMALDQLTDEQAATFLTRPDWLDFLANHDPQIKTNAQLAAWFGEVRGIMLELLTPEPESGISQTHATTQPNAGNVAPVIIPDGDTGREGGNG